MCTRLGYIIGFVYHKGTHLLINKNNEWFNSKKSHLFYAE